MQGPDNSAAVPAGEPEPTAALDTLWRRILVELEKELKREQFETWFRRTALIAVDDSVLRLAVNNGFTRDWLQRYYQEELAKAVGAVIGSPREVEISVDPERAAAPPPERESAPAPVASSAERAPVGGPPAASRSRIFDAQGLVVGSDVTLNTSYRFDSFVVGPCNRFAHAACVGVTETPGKTYNPLFLHGSVGLGKTHLLQSLCHASLERYDDVRILYLSCETFVNHFISALENGDLDKFRNKYRNVDVLVVDDIHMLANKERTQEEFFHTFNTLYNAGKQIVLSSDSPPVDIPTLQARLVSRFKWGLVTEVETPCYETRMAILKRKSRDRGHELPDDVARLLAEKVDTNIRELEGAVTKVLGYASLSGQKVSPLLVRQCLRELFHARRGQTSIEEIMGVVTERFAVRLSELQSRKRTNAIAFPRQIGMYLARRITRMSLEEIGGYLGGRDHSTVLYGVQKITRLAQEDAQCRVLLNELLLELSGNEA